MSKAINPVELMRSAMTESGDFALGSHVTLRIAVPEGIVLSGLDEAGKLYTWRDGDLLSVRSDELPELDSSKAAWIVRDVEQLLASGRFSDALKGARKATALA